MILAEDLTLLYEVLLLYPDPAEAADETLHVVGVTSSRDTLTHKLLSTALTIFLVLLLLLFILFL